MTAVTQSIPDSETLRRAALAASWRRSQGVARRRLWWRWTLWLLPRVLVPLGAVAALAWAAMRWTQPAPAPEPAHLGRPRTIERPPAADARNAVRPEPAPAAGSAPAIATAPPSPSASTTILLRLDLAPTGSATPPINPPGDKPR